MDSEEFISKLFFQDAFVHLNYLYIFLVFNNVYETREKVLYHVVVNDSAFETFLNTYKRTIKVIKYFSFTSHVHLILYSRNSIIAGQGIFSERLALEINLSFTQLSKITFNFCKNSHDAICKVLFTVPTLEITCMKTILNNLSGHVSNLKLPKLIIRKIFEFSKSYKNFPYCNGQKFIGSVQSPLIKLEFVNETISVVYFYLRDIHNNSFKICLNCMKMENEVFQRIRRKYSGKWKHIVANYLYWCQYCKQVPLFEVLSDDDQFEKEIVIKYHEYEFVKKPKVIDHFVNGEMIYSQTIYEYFILS